MKPSCPWFVLAALALALSACSRHVRLQVPQTSHAAQYSCTSEGCTQLAEDNPSHGNQARTAQLVLPKECAGRFHEIVILNAHSSDPEVLVKCAPTEKPIEEF